MKVLYLITHPEVGGAHIHLLELVKNLPAGSSAVFATGTDGFLCQELRQLGVPVRIIPALVHPIHPWKDLLALVAIVHFIRSEMPDLVHAHTSKAGLLGRLAARIVGIPAVFTAHTWSFADGVPPLQRWLSIPLERLAALITAKIINVSQANLLQAQRRHIASDEAMVRIWNGVPDVPERATPGARTIPTLITVARFVPQKDQLLLLQSLSKVDGDWRLLLVGDGPTRIQAEKACFDLGLQNRVRFLGERIDVPALLATADVFILPSKWEGFPLSILEAMRAGLPVIATDTGGVSEAVTEDLTGYLAGPGDALQLRSRLQQIISSQELRVRMGAAGRKRYEQDFRLETMVNKTLAVYREVLAAKQGVLVTGSAEA